MEAPATKILATEAPAIKTLIIKVPITKAQPALYTEMYLALV